jgi:hypothetical protein
MRLPESARFHLASFIFSIFAYVPCHVKQTRWQEAARAWEMTELPPSIFSLHCRNEACAAMKLLGPLCLNE